MKAPGGEADLSLVRATDGAWPRSNLAQVVVDLHFVEPVQMSGADEQKIRNKNEKRQTGC